MKKFLLFVIIPLFFSQCSLTTYENVSIENRYYTNDLSIKGKKYVILPVSGDEAKNAFDEYSAKISVQLAKASMKKVSDEKDADFIFYADNTIYPGHSPFFSSYPEEITFKPGRALCEHCAFCTKGSDCDIFSHTRVDRKIYSAVKTFLFKGSLYKRVENNKFVKVFSTEAYLFNTSIADAKNYTCVVKHLFEKGFPDMNNKKFDTFIPKNECYTDKHLFSFF